MKITTTYWMKNPDWYDYDELDFTDFENDD